MAVGKCSTEELKGFSIISHSPFNATNLDCPSWFLALPIETMRPPGLSIGQAWHCQKNSPPPDCLVAALWTVDTPDYQVGIIRSSMVARCEHETNLPSYPGPQPLSPLLSALRTSSGKTYHAGAAKLLVPSALLNTARLNHYPRMSTPIPREQTQYCG